MKDAVLYTRVSSREQEQEGFSLGAQSKLLREYAVKNDVRIVETFEDVETAKMAGRKQFSEMVKFLERNPSCRAVLVEKTDRLYRNFRDAVTLEDLDVEIHLVKENQVISKDSKSQSRLMHGIHVVLARSYSENLREEVKKGQRAKAETGIFPGHPPFGYRNNKAERTIEVHPENAVIVNRVFSSYATGTFSLVQLSKHIQKETGKKISKTNLDKMLKNPFYSGYFVWSGTTYKGTHECIIHPVLAARVNDVINDVRKPKYGKAEIAFRGLMKCAHDDCTVTGEFKKGKYVYYRCSGSRGKCQLPRFREEEIAKRLGEPLKNIHVPEEVVTRIVNALKSDGERNRHEVEEQRSRLQQRLSAIRRRIDGAYTDKLDGKISEELWQRKSQEWNAEEQQIQMALNGLNYADAGNRVMNAQRVLELANKAYLLYETPNSTEKAKLLKTVLWNCSIDAVSVMPAYRKPFDMIFERAKTEAWSGREDLNLRPPGPEL